MSMKSFPVPGHLLELGLSWCPAISVLSLFGRKGESQAWQRMGVLPYLLILEKAPNLSPNVFRGISIQSRARINVPGLYSIFFLGNQEIRGLRSHPPLGGVDTRHCYCTIPPMPGSQTDSPSYHMSAVTIFRVYSFIY